MKLDLEQFKAIMPRMAHNPETAISYLPHLQQAMTEFHIDNPARVAAFLAQIAFESDEFRYTTEQWNPQKVPAQLHYDPPFKLATKLGNTQKGDGYKYRGRSAIQITGKFNYQIYGKALGLDLVSHPELAESFSVGIRIAALYWFRNGLNALADHGDFEGITRHINGGTNGLAGRQKYWDIAKQVLGA